MQIIFNNINLKGYKHLSTNKFIINYIIEEKEIFKELDNYFIFLDTNYSELFIDEAFRSFTSIESFESSFKKDGFLIIVNKETGDISLSRDLSGLSTGYFYSEKNLLAIDSNVHRIAKKFSKKLNTLEVYQLIYFDFLWDGQTIYNNIKQVKTGGKLCFNNGLKLIYREVNQPIINENENELTEPENIHKLREEIAKALKPYINNSNIVYLSGGIDSVAMLIVLDDLLPKSKIENHSFKVKGTTQDETEYAKSIASNLGIKIKIIERDFKNELTISGFEKTILKMNNPYSGMWIFGNQINNKPLTTYFAGQDTRLHTPALNKLDQLAFNIFSLKNKGLAPLLNILNTLVFPVRFLFDFILSKKNIHDKKFLGLRRASYIFNTKSYLNLVYFKLDKSYLKALKLPLENFSEIKKSYNLDIKNVKNKRGLYNTLVSKKWIEQYVNDMRYMVDMVKTQGSKLAMPFYDMDLAKFSATIPFDLANKTMEGRGQFDDKKTKVNKYVLREALADKIDKKTYLRSKAVSRTGHLIFTQGLDTILKKIIIADLDKEESFVKQYKLEPFLDKFLNKTKEWEITDDKYLLKVYYTTCLCVYFNQINQ